MNNSSKVLAFLVLFAFTPVWGVMRQDCAFQLTYMGTASAPYEHPQKIKLSGSPETIIYSQGTWTAKRLLRLTSEQYKSMVQNELIEPDVILLLDRLPQDVDMPYVAGVIISAPLNIEGAHIQKQAQNQGMPMVFCSSAFDNPELVNIANKNGFVNLSAHEREVNLNFYTIQPADYPKTVRPSVQPEDGDRTPLAIFNGRNMKSQPLYIQGAKARPLSLLQEITPAGFIPEFFDMGPGFYEEFMRSTIHNGESLANFVRKQMIIIRQDPNEESVREHLKIIREAILSAQNPKFFDLLSLSMRGLRLKGPLSVRSNNEIEDMLGAGVFSSFRLENQNVKTLADGFQKAWSYMYSYRSYNLRRFRGAREENVSMPHLIHSYIDATMGHGTGSFAIKNEVLVFKVNIVKGQNAKATNPGEKDDVLSFEVRLDEKNQPVTNLAQTDPKLLYYQRAALEVFRILQGSATRDLLGRIYRPLEIDIEFTVGMQGVSQLLQYKARYSETVISDFFRGAIRLSDFEVKINEAESANASVEEYLKNRGLMFLADASANDLVFQDKLAVVMVLNKPRIIIWTARRHSEIESIINQSGSKIQWLVGHYISIFKNVMWFTPQAEYRRSNFSHPPREGYEEQFLTALREELSKNKALASTFNQVRMRMDAQKEFFYDTDSTGSVVRVEPPK